MDKRELLYFSLQGLHLLQKADKQTVISDLLGLQAQFANNPKYALMIRAHDFEEGTWDEGLVKIWSFRSTLHVVDRRDAPLHLAARGRMGAWEDSWFGLKKEVKPYWSAFLYERIAAGEGGREQLKAACRKQGMDEEMLGQVFQGWGGLFKEMCDRGMIAYETGTAKRFAALPPAAFMERAQAQAIILRRYFSAFGPATLQDFAFFAGLTQRDAARFLEKAGLPLREAVCEGVTYYHLNELTGGAKIPACLFLTGFDQLFMGYRDRSRMMEEKDKRNIITNTGIVFPTLLLDGKMKAKWKKEGQTLTVTPFEPLSARRQEAIQKAAAKLFGAEKPQVVFAGQE